MAVLKKGSKGSDVKKLQNSLNKQKAKPPLAEDGIFGPKTLEAVKTFQKKAKLKQDGQVGELTFAALKSGGKIPEMKVEDYKNKAAYFKKYRAYNVELVAGFMRIRKIVDILENDMNQVLFDAVKFSEANGTHWEKIYAMSEEIASLQKTFEKQRLKDPKLAQKIADECEAYEKKIHSIGKNEIGANNSKVSGILSGVRKSLSSSLTKIDAETKLAKKNMADFKD